MVDYAFVGIRRRNSITTIIEVEKRDAESCIGSGKTQENEKNT